MAIQVKRCTKESRAQSTQVLEAGQPLWERDTNALYVGDGTTQAKQLEAITAGRVDNYTTHMIVIEGEVQGSKVTTSSAKIYLQLITKNSNYSSNITDWTTLMNAIKDSCGTGVLPCNGYVTKYKDWNEFERSYDPILGVARYYSTLDYLFLHTPHINGSNLYLATATEITDVVC